MSTAPSQYPVPNNPSAPAAVPVDPAAVCPPPAAGQQVVYVPVQAPQSAPQQAPVQHHAAPVPPRHEPHAPEELRIYSHTTFFYWWPVWLTGYIMAVVTYVDGTYVQISNSHVLFHPSKNLGVIFTTLFFLVIIITNVTVRGVSSVVVILGGAFAVLFLAYFGLWETLLDWMGKVTIFMNMGFYVFFSSLVLAVWLFSVFVYDRLTYWKVRPGQITQEHVIGGAEKSYDTRGMVFEKRRTDLFRHWVIGLGSGDVIINTMGAKRETLQIPNVLFVNTKIGLIQQMIATKPDEFSPPVMS